MKKISVLDRILLLLTGLLAAYQIVAMDGITGLAGWAYTIAFGVLLVAGLLIIIMGFEVLDSPWVVIVSTIIPLSLSLGLVAEYLPDLTTPYLIFVIAGFLAVVATRIADTGKLATYTLRNHVSGFCAGRHRRRVDRGGWTAAGLPQSRETHPAPKDHPDHPAWPPTADDGILRGWLPVGIIRKKWICLVFSNPCAAR